MTWYARQIIAQNNERVLAELRADRRLENHVYIVSSLASFERVESEPFAVRLTDPPETLHRDVLLRPAFPAGGLIFVREVASSEGHEHDWFGDDALDVDLDAPGALTLEPESSLEIDGVLRYCKRLAERSRSTVCYFSTDYWGGDCEDARGYVFTNGEETSYLRQDTASVDMRTSRAAGEVRSIVAGDALTLCLLHFDVLLPSGHFLPHTRSFPWSQFRDERARTP